MYIHDIYIYIYIYTRTSLQLNVIPQNSTTHTVTCKTNGNRTDKVPVVNQYQSTVETVENSHVHTYIHTYIHTYFTSRRATLISHQIKSKLTCIHTYIHINTHTNTFYLQNVTLHTNLSPCEKLDVWCRSKNKHTYIHAYIHTYIRY